MPAKLDKPDTKTPAKPNPQANAKNELKSLPMAEVQKQLSSTPDGLGEAEAKKRWPEDGPNELAEKTDNPFLNSSPISGAPSRG